MKIITASLLVVLLFASAPRAQPRIIKFPELQSMLNQPGDTTYLFNFWATWCAPCLKELPALQKFAEEHAASKFKLILVSMDFADDFETTLLPFLKKHNVTSEVYLLDETDYNSWIDKVDSSWQGNLPATLVVNNSSHLHRIFPREFTFETLEQTIGPLMH